MKQSGNSLSGILIISLLLFVLSYIFYNGILHFLLPQVTRGYYQATNDGRELDISILFSFAIALIPVFIVATWRFALIESANSRVSSILIILACVAGAVYYRHQSIKSYLEMVSEKSSFDTVFPFEEVSFELYILGGLCAGFILSYILFGRRK